MPLGKLTKPSPTWVQRVPNHRQTEDGDGRVLLLLRELAGAPSHMRGSTAIRVDLGGFEGRSKAIRSSTTMVWNEAFFLPLRGGPLTLRIFAEDGHSDQVWASGMLDVPLGPLRQHGQLALQVPLFGDGLAAGRLQVELQRPLQYTGRNGVAPSVHLTVLDVRDLNGKPAKDSTVAVRLHLGQSHAHTTPRPMEPRVHFNESFELPNEGGRGLQLLDVHLAGGNGKVLATGTVQVDTTGLTVPVQQLVPVYDKATQVARVNVLVEAWDTQASRPEPPSDALHGGEERPPQTRYPPKQALSPKPSETVIEVTVIQGQDLPTKWTAGGVMVGVALDSSPPVLTAAVADRTDPTFSEGFEFSNATGALPPCLEVFLFQAQQPTVPVAYGSLPLQCPRSGVAVQEWVSLSADDQAAGLILVEVTTHFPTPRLAGLGAAGTGLTGAQSALERSVSVEVEELPSRQARQARQLSDRDDTVAQLEAQVRRVEAKLRETPPRPAPPSEGEKPAEPDGLTVLVRGIQPPLPVSLGPTHVEVALLAEATRTGDSDRGQWRELLALTVPPDLPDAKAVLDLRLISSRTGDMLGEGQLALPQAFLPGTGQGEATVPLCKGYTAVGNLQLELTLTDVATAQAAAASASRQISDVEPSPSRPPARDHSRQPKAADQQSKESSEVGETAEVAARWLKQQRSAVEAENLMEEVRQLQAENATLHRKLLAATAKGRQREDSDLLRLQEDIAKLHAENDLLQTRVLEAEQNAANAATLAAESQEGRMVAEEQLRLACGSPLPPMFPGLSTGSPVPSPQRGHSPAAQGSPLRAIALAVPGLPHAVRAELELQDREIRALAKRNVQLEAQLSSSPRISDAATTNERRVHALELELQEARAMLAFDGLCPQLSVSITELQCPPGTVRPCAVMRLGVTEAQLGLSQNLLGQVLRFPLPAAPEAAEALGDLRLVLYDADREELIGRVVVPLDYPALRQADWHEWVSVPPSSSLRFHLRLDPAIPRAEVRSSASQPSRSSAVSRQPLRDPLVLTVVEARGVEAPAAAMQYVVAHLGSVTSKTTERHEAVWREVFALDDPANVLRLELFASDPSGRALLLGAASVSARSEREGASGIWLPLTNAGAPAGQLQVHYHTNGSVLALHTRLKALGGALSSSPQAVESVPAEVHNLLNEFLNRNMAATMLHSECEALQGAKYSKGPPTAPDDYDQLLKQSTEAMKLLRAAQGQVTWAKHPLVCTLLSQLVSSLEAIAHAAGALHSLRQGGRHR
eukprot:GGOE01002618.1.p1 GENE.GGOE01002618.1~~GGOE01002618.1.p1  ORF type:complete len:1264 (-),score=312.99 GGOE01002618.1:299-4090(-)